MLLFYSLLAAFSSVIAVVVSWVLIPRVLIIAYEKKLFDVPDCRKIHSGVVPRLGGVTFFPTLLLSLMIALFIRCSIFFPDTEPLPELRMGECFMFIGGLVLIFLVGMADDLVGVSNRKKFYVQLIAATFIPLSGFWINNLYGLFGVYELPIWVGIPFTIFITALITNAINLIDGLDGLATSLCGIVFAIMGFIFIIHDAWLYAIISFCFLGTIIPFYIYNVFGNTDKKTKIFMGDTGSLTLGYAISFILIRYICSEANFMPEIMDEKDDRFMIALSLIFVPVFDVLRVMIVRMKKGNSPFHPDKNHIHHKFLSVGYSARATLGLIILLNFVFIIMNSILVYFDVNINIIFIADLSLWALYNIVLSKERARRKAQNKSIDVFLK